MYVPPLERGKGVCEIHQLKCILTYVCLTHPLIPSQEGEEINPNFLFQFLLAVGKENSCESLKAPLLSEVYTLNTASPVFNLFPPAIVAV